MTDEKRIDSLLSERAAEVFQREPEGDHLDDELLASRLEHGEALTAPEQAHLANCAECRDVAGHLLRSAPETSAVVVPLSSRRDTLAGLAVAASIAALTVLIALPPKRTDYRGIKGRAKGLTADVSLIVTSADGAKRDVFDGGEIATTERLGFRYGNPKARHRTLTIVGWDGARLHWYYPEKPEEAPPKIAGGEKALSIRMPFDVELDDHRPGELTIVAAFDADPRALAEKLKKGAVSRGDGIFVYRLKVEAPR